MSHQIPTTINSHWRPTDFFGRDTNSSLSDFATGNALNVDQQYPYTSQLVNEHNHQDMFLRYAISETPAMHGGADQTSNRYDNLSCGFDEQLDANYKVTSTSALMNQVTQPGLAALNVTSDCHGSDLVTTMTSATDQQPNLILPLGKESVPNERPAITRRQRLQPNDGIERPFVCPHCKSKFSMKHNMRRHIFVHHEGGIATHKRKQCDRCDKTFLNNQKLAIHQKVHHGVKLKFACEKCDQSFYCKFGLRDHENSHTGNRPYSCTECDARFMCYMTWHQHKVIHNGALPHACKTCDERFRYPIQLYNHQRICAGKKDASQNEQNMSAECSSAPSDLAGTLSQVNISRETAKEFCCDQCGRGFTSKQSLREHSERHADKNSFICSKCGLGFPTFERLRTHEVNKHTKRLMTPCKDCGKPLKTAKALSLHRRLHAGCPVCHEKFTMVKQLLSHACVVHVQEYECHLCCLTFPTFKQLKFHRLSDAHYMKKPYACTECPRRYVDRIDMEAHQQKHYSKPKMAERAVAFSQRCFTCCQCRQTFSQLSDLQLHEKVHKKASTGPFPVLVNNSGTSNADLEHRKEVHTIVGTHSPAVEVLTYKSDTSANASQQHMNPQWPHACRRCRKTFRSVRNLRLHQRTHSGRPCFSCAECDQRFSSVSKLVEHETCHEDYTDKVRTIRGSVKSLLVESNSISKQRTGVGIGDEFSFYVCRFCDAVFLREFTLKDHRLAHHGDCVDDDVDDKSAVHEEIKRIAKLNGISMINP